MTVYKITNQVNGKIYIGVTIRSLKERWNEHQSRAKERTGHLYVAMRYYGIENFTIESIDESAKTQEQLFQLEQKYIKEYNSMNPAIGYNMTIGGDGVKSLILDEDLIIRLYKEGHSSNEIAEQLGVSPNTICRRLKKHNISPNWNINEDLNNYIVEQYLIPRTVQDLIKETGKSKDSINRIIRMYGVKRHCFRESHENIEDIYNDYISDHMTNEQICTKYAIHKSTMYKLIQYYKETYLN